MKRILTVIGVLGFAVFAIVESRRDMWRTSHLSREQARAKVIEGARSILDLDLTGWGPTPEQPQVRHQLFLWQQRYAKTPFDRIVSGVDSQLIFTEGSGRVLTATLSQEGRLTSLRLTGRRRRDAEAVPPKARAEAAERAFRLIAGEYADRFTGPEEVGSSEYRWVAPSSDSRLRWQIVAKADTSGLRDVTIRPFYDESIRREFQHSLTAMGDPRRIVGVTLMFIGIPIISGMMIFSWMRKQVDRKAVYTAGLLVLVPAMFVVPYSMSGMGKSATIGGGVMIPLMSLLMASLIGVGQRAAREQEWNYWVGFRLFLHRQWKAKLIGEELKQGFLWAGWIAAIPSLIVVSGLFPDAHLGGVDALNSRMFRTPALNVILQTLEMFSVVLFATLLPLVSQRIPTRLASLAVFWPLATIGLYLLLPFISGPEATLICAALMSLGGIVLYLNHGVLSVLGLGKAMWMLWAASAVYNSAGGVPTRSFWALLSAYAALALISAVLAKKGTNALPEDPVAAQFLSQRERLKAEFSLAQQAQQRMIPGEPPALDGFSVAATCQPARDVGGDLYDYFSMPGGLTGFCVADVSGKGMPAALYMTLTKGLIAAASPDARSLADLASKINRHLHVACKRKVFVTAILAALDPKSRQVEFVRAGHNPALLYEAASKRARYLNPAGIGLGLAGPNLFDRGTKSASVTLEAGDALILYSDGVTEAMNEDLAQFGEDRLKQSLERCADGSAPYILSEIKKDLANFTGAEPAHDDVTLLVLQAQ